MNFFAVLHQLDGMPVPETRRRQLLGAPCCRELDTLQWLDVGPAAILVSCDAVVGPRPSIVRHGKWVGVGMVRLDHPEEVATVAGLSRQHAASVSHVELVLRAFVRLGTPAIARCIGDFAFVLIDVNTGQSVAARDPFGVRTLFHVEDAEIAAFASRAELLATPDHYDIHFIAEFLSGARPGRDSTVFAGVRPVAPGCIQSAVDGRRAELPFWDPSTFAMHPVARTDPKETIAEFRDLLVRGVQLRMTGETNCWSELSGGLDSSSVVSIAQSLARNGEIPTGLAGTITVVDTAGTGGDERAYQNAVVRMHGVSNELILDYGMLQDDGAPVPRTSQPACRLLFYARDRAICRVVRGAGGTVLLGGQASDQYLTGYAFFAADWLAKGQLGRVWREMTRWSVLGEVSFWELVFRNVVMPFLPQWVNAHLSRNAALPPWLDASVVRRFGLARRQVIVRAYAGPVGHKYSAAVIRSVGDIPYGLDRGLVSDDLEQRYPFLYRPLVEFALALSPEFCAVPTQSKWILREAMSGVLPESVRTRRGKGAIDGRLARSLAHEGSRIQRLLRAPILADLGCIDAGRLRAGVDAAVHGDPTLRASVIDALALELWLSTWSGRQTTEGSATQGRESVVATVAS